MLKGITKIELTDVNTGDTQVIEKHNNVTGALQELFNPVLGHLTNESKLNATIPAHTSLLGGLLLFNGNITGDPLPIFAPEGIKLVGCARYNYANTLGSTYIGSYDVNESVISPQDKMVKFVYNFTQSQANGTINSVCLTHISSGFGGYGGDIGVKQFSSRLTDTIFDTPTVKLVRNKKDRTATITASATEEYLYAIDADNDVAYYFRVPSTTTLVLLKRRIGLKHYSLFGGNDAIVGEPITITLNTALSVTGNAYNTYCFDTEEQALYIISTLSGASASNVPVGSKFTVTKYKLGGTTVTQTEITNAHTKAVTISSAYVYRGRVYMVDQYVLTAGTGSMLTFNVVSHSLADGTCATHGMMTQTYLLSAIPKAVFAMDGRLYWQTVPSNSSGVNEGGLHITDCTAPLGEDSTTLCGVDTIDHIIYAGSAHAVSFTPVINHPLLAYTSSYNFANTPYTEGFRFFTHYLGTINNLPTAIVKAPTQTMKITYTIQEV